MAQRLDKNKLRKHLFKFYHKHDPVALQVGFDINGLADYAMERGLVVLNKMLLNKYGAVLDYTDDVGTPMDVFKALSQGLSASTFIVAKEQEFRTKLFNFFKMYEPRLTDPKNEKQFEKYVRLAMLNGIDSLSEKLRKVYGAGLEADDKTQQIVASGEDEVAEFGFSGLNQFGLDVERLRDDLEFFYVEMEDVEQLEVLDQVTDWACEIGVEQLDKNLEQIYGVSLNTLLEANGKPIHFDFENNQNNNQVQQEPVNEVEEEEEFEIVYETVRVRNEEKEFEFMTDEEILQELEAFYRKNDPDNLEMLDKILQIARQIGRKALNKELQNNFEDVLVPVPEFFIHRVEKQIPRQVPDLQLRAPTPPTRVLDPNPNVGTFRPPPNAQMVMPHVDEVRLKPSKAKSASTASEEENVPEFLKIQRAMKGRIDNHKALMRDGKGNVVEVNLFIEVCKNYKLDPLGGICKNCQFAKSDHVWGIKNKRN